MKAVRLTRPAWRPSPLCKQRWHQGFAGKHQAALASGSGASWVMQHPCSTVSQPRVPRKKKHVSKISKSSTSDKAGEEPSPACASSASTRASHASSLACKLLRGQQTWLWTAACSTVSTAKASEALTWVQVKSKYSTAASFVCHSWQPWHCH